MKTLLALLLLIPSLSFSKIEFCEKSKEYKDWYDKNEKVRNKREVYIAQCILDHSKNSSTVPFYAIEENCGILASDKHKYKGEEPKYCK